jgi:hypothetical protein
MRLRKNAIDAPKEVATPAAEVATFDDSKLRSAIAVVSAKVDQVITKQNEPEPVEVEDKPKQWTFDVVKDRDGAIIKVVAHETTDTVEVEKPHLSKILYG